MDAAGVETVFEPLAVVLCEHLGEVTGRDSLDLILRSVKTRALAALSPETIAGAGQDPFADRAVRVAYLEAFREVAPTIFGPALARRVDTIERALEDGIVAA